MKSINADEAGREIYALIEELYPICRSITGNGMRQSLRIIQRHIPLEMREVSSGTIVFDWTIPKEWNIEDAYVKNQQGEKIIDFKHSNLHILNYSIPVRKTVSLEELREHLYTLPDHPDWIPYRTSYYEENWGFCIPHRQYQNLVTGHYEVFIDSTLKEGSLTYGELFLRGEQEEEVFISTHICHPSLCNDNLSGLSVATFLAKILSGVQRRYSYRFLFIPGTIGAIAWLNENASQIHRIRHGLVLTGVGDSGKLTYKKSRRKDTEIDRTVIHVFKHSGDDFRIIDFNPSGYDERQYCSPGFNLPVGRLSRTPYGEYPEYHTSADNLEFVKSESLGDTLSKLLDILHVLENNRNYLSLNMMCEPQLGKRGLYDGTGEARMAMLWVLNKSDGKHSLLDIAEESNIKFDTISQAANSLLKSNLLEEGNQKQKRHEGSRNRRR